MKQAPAQPREIEALVWVFHPSADSFPCGVWSSREKAEAWIRSVGAEGALSAYVLDEPAYESSVRLGLFSPRTAEHESTEFRSTFTTAVVHIHYPH